MDVTPEQEKQMNQRKSGAKYPMYFRPFRQATWMELFFDLVFVAVFGVIVHDLASTHDSHINVEQLPRFFLVFVPVWWIWTTHTMFANRYDTGSALQKFFTLALMGLVISLSPFIPYSLGENFRIFLVLYLMMRVILAALYLIASRNEVAKLGPASSIARAILVGAAISAVALFLESGVKFIFLYGGILIDMIIQAIQTRKIRDFPVHRKHLAERIGLLAIIILGEAIIGIVGIMGEIEWDTYDVLAAVAGFMLIGSIWWIYYGAIYLLERAKRLDTGIVLLYSNLIFCVGLIFIANMVRHAILGNIDNQSFALLSIAGMTMFYVGSQIPYMVAFPPVRFSLFVNSFVCILITVLSTFLPRIEYSMIGMALGMFVYVQLNIRWVIPSSNFDKYLVKM